MAWWKTAQAGDPVVCIKAPLSQPEMQDRVFLLAEPPLLGFACGDPTPIPGVILKRQRPPSGSLCEGYRATCFRPAQSSDLPAEIINMLKQPAPAETV